MRLHGLRPASGFDAARFTAYVIALLTLLDRMRSLESLTFMDEYTRYWAKDRE